MRRMLRFAVLAVAVLFAAPGHAVLPDEILDDPVLEARARALSSELRCLVCQNQSIDDSDAELARELRLLLRERILLGESDQQIVDYLVSRYGQFVLLKPQFNVFTALLWVAPFGLIVGGGVLAVRVIRRRSAVPGAQTDLTAEEERRLQQILSASGSEDG